MRYPEYLLALLVMAGASEACSSSSNNEVTLDGGTDGPHITNPDARTDGKVTTDGGHVVTPDGGDGGQCNFATFVIGLIKNDTSGTAKPSSDLGESCTDDMKQSEFSSLF